MSTPAQFGFAQQQAQAYWNHARAMHNGGQFVEAAQAYTAVLKFNPASWSAYYNLGVVCQELGRLDDARDSYQHAIRLNPALAQAHNNLGNVLQNLARSDEALEAYGRALKLDPALVQAHYNSALILREKGRLTDSVASLQRTVELDPANNDAWESLFSLLYGLKRKEEAFATFLRWEQATPPNLRRLAAGLIVSRLTGDAAGEERYLAQVGEWPFPAYSPRELVLLLGNLQYFDVPAEVILACYHRFNRASNAQGRVPIPLLPRRSPGKIRVGYMSPDFREHVMGRIMLEILRSHDRDRFDIYLVSTCNPHFHDETTRRFRELAAGFADIHDLTDLAAAQAIAEVDLDILVDLAGHTLDNRTGVYAHRPARHIVTHLGYHGCLGMDAVEYKFTDRFADTEESVRYQIEKPYFLDACVMPFAAADGDTLATSRDEARRALGFDDKFVFCTFVNPIKLSPRCLAAWGRVLERVPASVLAFSPYEKGDYPLIQRQLQAAGIDPARVVFIDIGGNDAERRARYAVVDAALDTFPYAGGDTTLAALDMNVPVVTLVGLRHSERIGFSILNHLGVTDTIAASEAEFVDIATRLAQDQVWHREVRERLRAARHRNGLARIDLHTRALERAFTDIADLDALPAGQMESRMFYADFKLALKKHQGARDEAERDAAAADYDRLLLAQPEFGPLLYARGMLANETGHPLEAADYLARAVEAMPRDTVARVALADLLVARGAADAAVEVLAPVVAAEPRNVRARLLTATACLQSEAWQAAADAAQAAAVLAPTNVEVLFALAVALSHLSRGAEALANYNRVLALDGKHLPAAYNAALLLRQTGDLRSAESLLHRVLSVDARHELAYWRLTDLLLAQGRLDEFAGMAARFSAACPASLKARFRSIQHLQFDGQLEEAGRQLRALAGELAATGEMAHIEELLRLVCESAFDMDFSGEPLRHLLAQSRKATERLFGEAPSDAGTVAPEKLKIGYLTAQSHATFAGRMLLSVLRAHDRSRFETVVYALDASADEITREISGAADRFVAIQDWTAEHAVADMRRSDLHALIDLTAAGDERASMILAGKPARASVLLPWLSPHGSRHADFRLTSTWQERPVADEMLPAKALALSNFPYPWFERGAIDGDATAARARHLIPAGALIFGVFAPPELISYRCVSIWKAVLERAGASMILIAPPIAGQAGACRRILEKAGIDPARILAPKGHATETFAWERHLLIDILLDTLPTSHAASVLDAVARAIPVVTQPGQLPAERSGGAILAALGVSESVADGGTQYVELATRLATDTAWRESIVDRLRRQLPHSALADLNAFMREYEARLAEICTATDRHRGSR